MAVGGYSSNVEALTSSGWKQLPYPLPMNFLGQCMALINSTTAIVMGGFQALALSKDTYVISNSTRTWTLGPPLNDLRGFHTCGRILTNKATKTYGVIVVSGYDGTNYLSSVELLDQGATSFVRGKPLPVALLYNSLVEDPAGGIIIINGLLTTGMKTFL